MWFTKKADAAIEEYRRTSTQKQIIEEIHETFFTEVDRLLAQARIVKSTDSQYQDLINKHDRLTRLGFTSTKEVTEAKKEIDRLAIIKKENEENKELIEAINYFSKYVNYKFITEDSVKKICQKYGLIYGPVDKYIGTVPDKNLKHIEDFRIDEKDCAYIEIQMGSWHATRKFVHSKEKDTVGSEAWGIAMRSHYITHTDKAGLEIAAPKSDFDTKNMVLEGYQLKQKPAAPDPIVLQPVMFKNKKHYLIVTAWGLEAEDEIVVNHKMN